jgi:hypothetical protein
MSKMKVGGTYKTVSGDFIQVTSNVFTNKTENYKKDGKTLKREVRGEYIFQGKVTIPGPKRAKDKEGKPVLPPAGLKWDLKGKAYGKKKDKSYDLVL